MPIGPLWALPILCPGVKLSCPPVQNLNDPPEVWKGMWFKCDQLFVVEERCLMTQKQLRGRRGGELLDDTKQLRGRLTGC